MLVVDEHSLVVWFNPSFGSAFGVAAAAILQTDLSSIAGGRFTGDAMRSLLGEARKHPTAPARRVGLSFKLDGAERAYDVGARMVQSLATDARLVLVSFEPVPA